MSVLLSDENKDYEDCFDSFIECGKSALELKDWISGKNAQPAKENIYLIQNKFMIKNENEF